jgi:hypothetical protein
MKAGLALACLIAAIAAGTHLATLRAPRCEQCGIAHADAHLPRTASR